VRQHNDSTAIVRHIPLTTEEVKSYLRENAESVANDAELLSLVLPKRDVPENVEDIQSRIIERLRGKIANLQSQRADLVHTVRGNVSAQERVHIATLRFLEAESLGHLNHILMHELAPCLDLDAVALCVESSENAAYPSSLANTMQFLPDGMVDILLGRGELARLNSGQLRLPSLYGDKTSMLRSEALVRLNIWHGGPSGILALASSDPDAFRPDQGADLLDFLARALERCMRNWLTLAAK
jgi:hypothetical protein